MRVNLQTIVMFLVLFFLILLPCCKQEPNLYPDPTPSVSPNPQVSVTQTPGATVTQTPGASVTQTPGASVTQTPIPSVTPPAELVEENGKIKIGWKINDQIAAPDGDYYIDARFYGESGDTRVFPIIMTLESKMASANLPAIGTNGGEIPAEYADNLSLVWIVFDGETPVARGSISGINLGSTNSITEYSLIDHNYLSSYLTTPDDLTSWVMDCADFWLDYLDETYGGFYNYIDGNGNITDNTRKSLVVQSRNVYAMSRAFMLSGDDTYLAAAESARDFLYSCGWDDTYGGWYFSASDEGTAPYDIAGGWQPNNKKWSFTQHYNMLGPLAIYEVNRSLLDKSWIDKGYLQSLDYLWEGDGLNQGYYQDADLDWGNLRGKGFTATIDAITTNALWAVLCLDDESKMTRFTALANQAAEHLAGNIPMYNSDIKIGFPEKYNSDWTIDTSTKGGGIGHVIKTSWCLARAYMLTQDLNHKNKAKDIFMHSWNDGFYDTLYGGSFMSYNWSDGTVTDNTKDYWMLEQCVMAGLSNYHIADNTDLELKRAALEMTSGTLDFYFTHLKRDSGVEINSQVSVDGSKVENSTIGDNFKGAYHNIEMAYLAYLYANFFYHKEPVTLYYNFEAQSSERSIKLTPCAIEDDALQISAVEKYDGSNYQTFTDFNVIGRTINLAADEGGKFRVTFTPVF